MPQTSGESSASDTCGIGMSNYEKPGMPYINCQSLPWEQRLLNLDTIVCTK